ncbi:unnamed protein product, partial [Dovyalis caffra]
YGPRYELISMGDSSNGYSAMVTSMELGKPFLIKIDRPIRTINRLIASLLYHVDGQSNLRKIGGEVKSAQYKCSSYERDREDLYAHGNYCGDSVLKDQSRIHCVIPIVIENDNPKEYSLDYRPPIMNLSLNDVNKETGLLRGLYYPIILIEGETMLIEKANVLR